MLVRLYSCLSSGVVCYTKNERFTALVQSGVAWRKWKQVDDGRSFSLWCSKHLDGEFLKAGHAVAPILASKISDVFFYFEFW